MARKKTSTQLTPLELEIMKVLWDTGPVTVQVVQQRLPAERNLAYTSVQTVLNILDRKGKVTRKLKDRAYYYRPVLTRQKALSQAIGDVLDRLFGGSAESLVLNLVETRRLTPEKLARINELLEQPKGSEHGNG